VVESDVEVRVGVGVRVSVRLAVRVTVEPRVVGRTVADVVFLGRQQQGAPPGDESQYVKGQRSV
jgi:hypothetical protein